MASMGRKLAFGVIPSLVLFTGLELILMALPGSQSSNTLTGLITGLNMSRAHFVEDPKQQLLIPNRNEMSRFTGLPLQVRPGRLRVATFGGSTMATARPAGPAWQLAALLSLGSGGRSDLINAGGAGYGSTRIRLALKELSQHHLDVAVLYTGHNEFMEHKYVIGARPLWFHRIGDLLTESWRCLAWLRNMMGKHDVFEKSKVARMEELLLLDGQREMLLQRFQENLQAMAEILQEEGIRAVWVLPASNLAAPPMDDPPTSTAGGGGHTGHHAESRQIQRALEEQRYDDALAAAEGLLKANPTLATAWYSKGQALNQLGRPSQALAALRRARDLDRNPRRATSSQRSVLRATAERYGISVVDAEQVLLDAAFSRYLSGSFTTDRMHLSAEGYRLVAGAIYQTLRKSLGALSPMQAFSDRLPAPGNSLEPVIGPKRRTVAAPTLAEIDGLPY